MFSSRQGVIDLETPGMRVARAGSSRFGWKKTRAESGCLLRRVEVVGSVVCSNLLPRV